MSDVATPPAELEIRTLIDTLPAGARVLDLGAGAGTFPHHEYPALRTVAVDILDAPELAGRFARASAHQLPLRTALFDVVVAHWQESPGADVQSQPRQLDARAA